MNDYLGREGAPFSAELWQQIDGAVVNAAKETLVARRFLPLYGPLGAGVGSVPIDRLDEKEETSVEEGFAYIEGRTMAQIPQLHEDFWLYWRDIEMSEHAGVEINLSAAQMAAQKLALREDKMIFYGVKALGIEGLLTAKGIGTIKRGDWSQGEGAYADVAKAMTMLLQKGRMGRLKLLVSPDVLVQLERLQPGTGVLESQRIEKLLGSKIYMSLSLEPNTAALISAQPQYMDLVVGQDIRTAYTEAVDLNHHLRVLETALPRIKAPDAVVVLK